MWKGTKPKYGNEKTQVAGHWFDSKLEAALFHHLTLRERSGEISSLTHQPGTVFLGPARVQYRPDFRFHNTHTGQTEYAESKGFADSKWPLKKKLWKFHGPGKLEIWMGSYKNIKLIETIIPTSGICKLCGK